MSKAVLFRRTGNGVLELVHDWALPARQAGQIKVAVKSSSFNPVDLKIWTGVRFAEQLTLPKVPGGDVAGIVIETDPDSKFKEGDAVIGVPMGGLPWTPTGAWSEHTLGNAADFATVPSTVSLENEAGAIPLVSLTAFQGLENCNLKPGARVLITAASGGVGHVAIQLAKHYFKAHVVAMTSDPEFVKKLGADEIVDHTKEDFSVKYKDEPFDAILDLLGGDFEPKAYKLLTPTGTYSHVSNSGTDRARSERNAREWKDQKYTITYSKANGTQLQLISDLIQAGTIRVHVDSTVPLETVVDPKKVQELATRKKQGKVVIKI